MKRLSQPEMKLVCGYIRNRFGKLTFRERRKVRRTMIRTLKRAPPSEKGKRYSRITAYYRSMTTT